MDHSKTLWPSEDHSKAVQALFRSSGDLIADRPFNFACSYAEAGASSGRPPSFSNKRSTGPRPGPTAWFALGRAREASACRQAAVAAFARAAALDPSDELGASLHLARLGGAAMPAIAPEPYVRSLFDQYAATFDAHLDHLSIARRPFWRTRSRVSAATGSPVQSILDAAPGFAARPFACARTF
jgi:hypothetical protein